MILRRRNLRDDLAFQTLIDKLPQEFGKGDHIAADACLFQRPHIGITALKRHHCPGIAICGLNHIHQEPPHAAVAVGLGVDIDEDEMTEHDADTGLGFFGQ